MADIAEHLFWANEMQFNDLFRYSKSILADENCTNQLLNFLFEIYKPSNVVMHFNSINGWNDTVHLKIDKFWIKCLLLEFNRSIKSFITTYFIIFDEFFPSLPWYCFTRNRFAHHKWCINMCMCAFYRMIDENEKEKRKTTQHINLLCDRLATHSIQSFDCNNHN